MDMFLTEETNDQIDITLVFYLPKGGELRSFERTLFPVSLLRITLALVDKFLALHLFLGISGLTEL